MDDWGFEHLGRWRAPRSAAGRSAVLHHRRLDPRAGVARDRCARRTARTRRAGGCSPPSGATSIEACARCRTRARGGAGEHHSTPARAYRPRHDLHLLAGDRPQRDRQRRALAPSADDARHSTRPLNAWRRRSTASRDTDRWLLSGPRPRKQPPHLVAAAAALRSSRGVRSHCCFSSRRVVVVCWNRAVRPELEGAY